MKSPARYSIIILTSLGLLIGQWGCAHSTPKTTSFPPEKVTVELGTAGLVSAKFQPESTFRKPLGKGGSAAAGTGMGLLAGAGLVGGAVGWVALAQPWTIILLAYPPVTAVVGGAVGAGALIGGLVGGITGAAKAESSKTIKESEAALHHVLADLDAQALMQAHFLNVVRERGHGDLVVLEGLGPTALDQEVTYASFSDEGFDTVLEISVRKYGLWGEKGINPLLSFFMTVTTRIIRIKDDTVIHNRTFRYESTPRKYVDWTIDDAQPFRKELDHACETLATEIAEALFISSEQTAAEEI